MEDIKRYKEMFCEFGTRGTVDGFEQIYLS